MAWIEIFNCLDDRDSCSGWDIMEKSLMKSVMLNMFMANGRVEQEPF